MGLVRSIGRWSLAALVVNAIVGSTIFGIPSEVIRLVGWAGPVAMILAALIISAALILYCGVCAALIKLRKTNPEADALRIPFGRATAVTAISISAALISSLDWQQGILITLTALFAAVNWWAARRKDSVSAISVTAAGMEDRG